MTPIEKKAIEHCINKLNSIRGIHSALNDSLDKHQIPIEKQKSILRDANDAISSAITDPIDEIKDWLRILTKDS